MSHPSTPTNWSDTLKESLRQVLRKQREKGEGDISTLLREAPEPLYMCKDNTPRRITRFLKIAINMLPLLPLIIAAAGYERGLFFTLSIIIAVAAFLVSPFLIEEEPERTARSIASSLTRQGVDLEWGCYDGKLVFIGFSREGYTIAAFRNLMGIRYTFVLVKGTGVLLPTGKNREPGYRVLSKYFEKIIEGRGEPGLSFLSVKMLLGNAEVVLPYRQNPRIMTLFRGRTLLLTIPLSEIESFLEDNAKILPKLYESPRLEG